MYRVMIIGCGGSGKSTPARRLSKRTGLPVHHLDRMYWKPGWAETPKAEWAVVQESLIHLKENLGSCRMRFVRFGRGTTDHHAVLRQAVALVFSGFIAIELSPNSEGLTPGRPDVENLVFARQEYERYAAPVGQ